MTNRTIKSKVNKGRLRNSMVNILKVDKIMEDLKKSQRDINGINNDDLKKEENKKEVKNIKLNILKSINNNAINDSLYSEVNDEGKNSNKAVNSENNKCNSNATEVNNNNNKSSTSYNFKLNHFILSVLFIVADNLGFIFFNQFFLLVVFFISVL